MAHTVTPTKSKSWQPVDGKVSRAPDAPLASRAVCHRRPACHHLAGTPADLNYLASAASCAAALCSAALTAARNESVPEGACTLPDNVLSKETFFP